MNGPLAPTVRLSPPLSCYTTDPDNPDTEPPTEYVCGGDDPAPPPAQLSAFAVPNVMIPGAPPVMLVSVTLIRVTPFCRKEIVDPTAVSCSCVPAASGPELYELPSWIQVPALRAYSRSC